MANFNYNIWQRSDVYPSNTVPTRTQQVQFGQANQFGQASPQMQLGLANYSQPTAQQASMTTNSGSDFYLKVLCPENKKDYKTVTLRGLSPDNIDSPTKLKEAISAQCEGLDPLYMDVGYFVQAKKLWINSRLDINDVWNSVGRGERLTLWCVSIIPRRSNKRKHDDDRDSDTEGPLVSKKSCSSQGPSAVELRKATSKEYEHKLVGLHNDKWTSFQYKLWAEMLACGTHTSENEPPSASMFNRDSKHSSKASGTPNDTVVSGMMTVMNSLCLALAPKPTVGSTYSSPVKRAELRGTYMKQLTELKQLQNEGILDQYEYEEQRTDLVELICKLK